MSPDDPTRSQGGDTVEIGIPTANQIALSLSSLRFGAFDIPAWVDRLLPLEKSF